MKGSIDLEVFAQWYEDRYGSRDYREVILPKEREEEEVKAWKEKLTEMLWERKAKQRYIHRWWRVDTYLGKIFSELWLYCWPVFTE